ncbi:MAG: hypothetical protein M3275_08335 [Thermoproteota archaeon]|nr:hypothetical protein [Thermoproteota archaeon]
MTPAFAPRDSTMRSEYLAAAMRVLQVRISCTGARQRILIAISQLLLWILAMAIV